MAGVVAGLMILLGQNETSALRSFIGHAPPLLVMVIAVLVGAMALGALERLGGFVFYRSGYRGIRLAAILAVLFGVVVIPADFLIVYPPDINVPWPASLLFYPVAGFLVEILLHLLPLTLLIIALTGISRRTDEKRVWIAVALTTLLEPAYQSWWMWSLHQYSFAAQAFNTLHVLAFNLAELALFRRYDFVSMYAFRLVYYAIWHVGWGTWRLEVLF